MIPTRPPALRDLARPHTALYMGRMGARDRNFYNALVRRYGSGTKPGRSRTFYLAGHKAQAEEAIPSALLEQTSLIGSEAYLKDRLAAHRAAPGVTVINVKPVGRNPTDDLARLRDLMEA